MGNVGAIIGKSIIKTLFALTIGSLGLSQLELGAVGAELSLEAEKSLDEFQAFVLQDTDFDSGGVVHSWILVDVEGTAEAAHLGVGDGENNAADARHDRGSGAHGAGLFGDVESGFIQAPVVDGIGGLSDGDHFRVGGRVVGGLDLVVPDADDLAFMGDDRSDGDFVFFPGVERLVEGERHVEAIVANQLGWVLFGEGAIGRAFFGVMHRVARFAAKVKILD